MHGISPLPVENSRSEQVLPYWLARYTDTALYGLAIGTALCLFALFTNPVPDPSFPWATLPASLRLPVTQPRIEHWPVSYSLGIWLWVFCAPALILAGYRRYRTQSVARLVGLPTAAMLGLTTYCRFFWPKLYPPSWNAPAYTFVCWLYCATYDPLWSNLAYGIVALGIVATIVAIRESSWDTYALVAFEVLALPLGLPALYEAYRRRN
jgi:hypothetical protein